MRKKNEKNITEKKKRKEFNKGTVFVRIMAGCLALLMLLATGATLIFALMEG